MQNSAELRWFWKAESFDELRKWFCGGEAHFGIAAGGGSEKGRDDVYLYDIQQHELGIKKRGAKPGIEIKGLVNISTSEILEAPFKSPIQFWSKWTSSAYSIQGQTVVMTKKRRWLRKFNTEGSIAELELNDVEELKHGGQLPNTGCNVELTRIELPPAVTWWSFGFESFGDIDTLASSLGATAGAMRGRNCPWPEGGILESYPGWLAHHVPSASVCVA